MRGIAAFIAQQAEITRRTWLYVDYRADAHRILSYPLQQSAWVTSLLFQQQEPDRRFQGQGFGRSFQFGKVARHYSQVGTPGVASKRSGQSAALLNVFRGAVAQTLPRRNAPLLFETFAS
jgi:hypothetical protein